MTLFILGGKISSSSDTKYKKVHRKVFADDTDLILRHGDP